MMRNIETFPSKQISLIERKVAEFYHNIDRLMTYFHRLFRTIDGVLVRVSDLLTRVGNCRTWVE